MANKNYLKQSASGIMFDGINIFIMVLLMVVMIYPFWNTLIVSFNDAIDSIKGGVFFWPRKFTTYNYVNLFQNKNLISAFWISVTKTILTTVLNVFFSSLTAFILSRKDFILKKFMTVFLVATMYVNAGLIPTYFNYKSLGLINNYLVYIVPGMLGVFNVIVIRTFINGLPESYAESAKIDGAGEFRIFMQIILPLCKPILATVALWVAVGSWNDWFTTYIYASSKQYLSTLQYEMMKLLASSMIQSGQVDPGLVAASGAQAATVTPNSIRAAITIVAATPIIMIYPFLQKYFVTVNIGGVKG